MHDFFKEKHSSRKKSSVWSSFKKDNLIDPRIDVVIKTDKSITILFATGGSTTAWKKNQSMSTIWDVGISNRRSLSELPIPKDPGVS